MSDRLLASYRSVPYESAAIPLTDPDAIAAIALLHGITPPPPESCRVLELGCASGGNLISMAFRYPRSRFVGVDFAPEHVEVATFAVAEMGLQNIEVETRSIADIDDGAGKFDYVICHGVYSWAPPEVQDAILRVCSHNLAEKGIAYVSYNTYPGWHQRAMLREMLLFHDDPSMPPEDRLSRARNFAKLLMPADAADDSPHAVTLRHEIGALLDRTDRHIFHEQLEVWNEPLYFADFAARAANHRLQYLAEAKLSVETQDTLRIRETLGPDHDSIRMEQYLDFVRGRPFRRTLLCHEGRGVARSPKPDAVTGLFVRATCVPVPPSAADAARGPGVAAFRTVGGITLTTNNPLIVATLRHLVAAAPAVVSVVDLRHAVAETLAAHEDPDARRLLDEDALEVALVQCAASGVVEFRARPSSFVVRPGPRPKASALARWQALHFPQVSSLGHWPVTVSGMERFLLEYLDGTNDRGQLVRRVEQGFATGDLNLGGAGLTRPQISEVLDDTLQHLGRGALLVA